MPFDAIRVASVATRIAIPHVNNVECGAKRFVVVDMLLEFYGTGKLPKEYELILEKFFGTKNKRKMMSMAYWREDVPILCPNGVIEIVDQETGDVVRKIKTIKYRR